MSDVPSVEQLSYDLKIYMQTLGLIVYEMEHYVEHDEDEGFAMTSQNPLQILMPDGEVYIVMVGRKVDPEELECDCCD